MHRNKSVDVHQFAMVPRADIPRSSFRMQKGYKTTFDAGKLVPFYVDEVLPGDSFNVRCTLFARLQTLIYPLMDNMYLETFFFFVPNRLVWDNWQKFMGEQIDPGDSTDFLVPTVPVTVAANVAGSLYDYFGIPGAGQLTATINVNALPFRAYNLIWNEWFRDQNLQDSLPVSRTDGPDLTADYAVRSRGKRHDYFTSCLPWTQKGVSVGVPVTGTGTVVPGVGSPSFNYAGGPGNLVTSAGSANVQLTVAASGIGAMTWNDPKLDVVLGNDVEVLVNQMRQSFQVQKLLERDARGGTRYTEMVRSHFGVISPDSRLQRPEYLGGGSSPLMVNPVAQTSGTAGTGAYTPTPLGELAAFATVTARNHGFHQSFTEHGYVIGLVNVRADLTYQQGLRKLWSRQTRYDFFFPVFSMLGEQAVLNKEIYCTGAATDDDVFGYQEAWASYRYNPSEITGQFRSSYAQTLDGWHLAQEFSALPTLSSSFITDSPPIERVIAVGAAAGGAQFLMDSFIDVKAARPMPLYSVPGMVDHF